MRAFAPAFSQEALATLLAAGGSQRKRTLAAIDHLCRFPNRMGDCPVITAEGRKCSLLLRDGILFTYWVDDAVQEVRIVSIEWPD